MASSLRWALLCFLVLSGLVLLFGCDLVCPEEDPWLRVWWAPMPDSLVLEDHTGIYLHAYAHPPQEVTWEILQEWEVGYILWDGTLRAGTVLQMPVCIPDEVWSLVTLWASTRTLGPDSITYEHLAQGGA